MSAFDKQVRARVAEIAASSQLDATAEAIGAGMSPAELVDRAAFAARAYELQQRQARSAHVQETVRKRQTIAAWGARHGLADEQGNVRRLDVKRALAADAERLRDVPAAPPTAPPEPRRPSGLVVPRPGELLRAQSAADFERERVRE